MGRLADVKTFFSTINSGRCDTWWLTQESGCPAVKYLYGEEIQEEETTEMASEDKHLRSMDEITGYHVQTLDGWLGHVADFIINDETWTIRYIAVDTRNWLPGKKVLLSPNWIDSTDWAQRKVHVDVTSQQVKDCPEYDPAAPVNREYEARLYDFYGRPKYW